MHLSTGLWISCFVPYLSLIFKESLSFLQITETSSLRGEHKTHASVIHHMVSCYTAGNLHNGSKRLLSQSASVRHVSSILGYKREDLQTKEAWPSRAGWEAIGCAGAQRNPQALPLYLWYLLDRDRCLTWADTNKCLHHQWTGLPILIVMFNAYNFYIWL